MQRNAEHLPILAQLARIYLGAKGSLALSEAVMKHAAEVLDQSGGLGHKAMCQVLRAHSLIRRGHFDPMADQSEVRQGDPDWRIEERLAEHEVDWEKEEGDEDQDGEEGGEGCNPQ